MTDLPFTRVFSVNEGKEGGKIGQLQRSQNVIRGCQQNARIRARRKEDKEKREAFDAWQPRELCVMLATPGTDLKTA